MIELQPQAERLTETTAFELGIFCCALVFFVCFGFFGFFPL
jgi:hypothetical protein